KRKEDPYTSSLASHGERWPPRRSRHPPVPFPSPPAPLSLTPSPNSAALVNAHWVPTREQLAVLEGLYRQGMRTPTAEEIHQVTARLQEHGPIEGRNVFHWFQNQHVRLRQRERSSSGPTTSPGSFAVPSRYPCSTAPLATPSPRSSCRRRRRRTLLHAMEKQCTCSSHATCQASSTGRG
uniref:Homeobox domain-containing protein n=1 Tax=Aegilops tauschii subsp. strangulata TaxID=200361 RepID=A0A453FWD6_AEGTS